MKQLQVGNSGLRVSEIGLGTMTWGIPGSAGTDADEAAEQLIAFHDAGGTLVDTAPVYGNGESQRILGRLVADVVPRSELVVATKAGIHLGPHGFRSDASRGTLLDQLDESLRDLAVDHIDLWFVHYPDRRVAFDETLSALDYAVNSGKVRYAAVSNYSGWRLGQAVAWQRAIPGRAPIVGNQVRYSLLDRGIEREVVPAALDLGVGIFPWSPLGGGILTGKYRDGVPADSRVGGSPLNPGMPDAAASGIVEAVATAADGLATSPVAVALAWLRARPGVTAPILGARTVGQVTAALATLELTLPEEISAALDDVSAPPIGYPEDVR